jgi:hypothetical protein
MKPVPRVHLSDLGRGLVAATVLALFVCFGQNLEQFLSYRHRLAFVANLFQMLVPVSSLFARTDDRDSRRVFCPLLVPA